MRTFECSLTSAPFQQHLDEIAFQWQSCFNRTSWILQFFSPEYADLLFPWLKSRNNSFIHSLCIYWSYIFNHRAYHYIQVWKQLSLAHLYLTSLSKFATITLLETYGFILIEKLLNSLFLNWLVILNDYIWQESGENFICIAGAPTSNTILKNCHCCIIWTIWTWRKIVFPSF